MFNSLFWGCVCVFLCQWVDIGGRGVLTNQPSPFPPSQQEVAPSSCPHQNGNICSVFWNPGTLWITHTPAHTHTHTQLCENNCRGKPAVRNERFCSYEVGISCKYRSFISRQIFCVHHHQSKPVFSLQGCYRKWRSVLSFLHRNL